MPITPLPEDTIRLLGSAAVITTPVSLVKELLENALDAGATSVDILISQNAIDRIEVRDNGSGIHANDYECLGRPGHTSKLTSLEDLRTVGATTFGFRGQALASANTLGDVTITTRTPQDPTAMRLELRHGLGGVENVERTSAPVGTSVSVTALFSRIPVRKQVILRDSHKHIVDIKHLLRAYAFARTQIRLSFKVVGGNPNQSWSYSPRPQASVKEAVVQVLGTGVMSQCLLQTFACEEGTGDDDSHGNPEFIIDAVLPKPDADLSKLSKGPFFSVDSRPISTRNGTGKTMLAAFRTQIKKSRQVDDGLNNLNDLFVQANIKCSPGSYDPNIEPLKNEVLFSNESQLIDLFKRLCAEVYKSQGTQSPFVAIEKRQLLHRTQTCTPPPSSDGPEGGEESVSLVSNDTAGDEISHPPQMSMPSHSSPLHTHSLCFLTQPVQQPRGAQSPRDNPDMRHDVRSPLLADNPGSSSAQVNAPTRQTRLDHALVLANSGRDTNKDHTQMEIQDIQDDQTELAMDTVPPHGGQDNFPCRPAGSDYQSYKRGFKVDMSADPDMSSDEEAEVIASRFRELHNIKNQVDCSDEHSKEGLNPWVIAKMTAPTQQPTANTGISIDESPSINHRQEPSTFCSASEAFEEELPVLRPLGGPPGDLDPPHTMRLHNPHSGDHHASPASSIGMAQTPSGSADYNMPWPPVEPARLDGRRILPDLRGWPDGTDEMVDPDGFIQTNISFGGPKGTQKTRNSQKQMHINNIPERPNPRYRKPKRVDGRNLHLPTNEGIRHSGSPNGDQGPPSQASFWPQESRPAQQPCVPDSSTGRIDGVACDTLIRRQRLEADQQGLAHQTIKRTKSGNLPLERIPQGYEVQHLVLVVKPDMESFGRNQKEHVEDEDIENESLCATMGLQDVAEIEGRLKQVLSVWAEDTLGETIEVDINLRTVVKGKGVAT